MQELSFDSGFDEKASFLGYEAAVALRPCIYEKGRKFFAALLKKQQNPL